MDGRVPAVRAVHGMTTGDSMARETGRDVYLLTWEETATEVVRLKARIKELEAYIERLEGSDPHPRWPD